MTWWEFKPRNPTPQTARGFRQRIEKYQRILAAMQPRMPYTTAEIAEKVGNKSIGGTRQRLFELADDGCLIKHEIPSYGGRKHFHWSKPC